MRRVTMILAGVTAGTAALAVAQTAPDNPPAAASEPSLTAPVARQVARNLADTLERNFVLPDVARRYAAALRAHAQAGDYDRLTDRAALAEALTRDVQAVQFEGHFRVNLTAPSSGPAAGAAPPAGPRLIEEARWLAPGIAYLRPTIFAGSPEEVGEIDRFLTEVESARTLILDMRVHRGGGLAEMDAIFGRLYAAPTRLLVMDARAAPVADGRLPLTEGPTLRRAEASADIVRFEHWALPRPGGSPLADARVYVLISGFTVSAGEHFALALQRTGRATLIGAGTQGAGNFGTFFPFGEGLGGFVGIGRTYDPDTGEGWEGTGVNPDIEVAAPRALVEALTRSGITPAEAERLSASVAPAGSMELRPGRPVPVRRPRR